LFPGDSNHDKVELLKYTKRNRKTRFLSSLPSSNGGKPSIIPADFRKMTEAANCHNNKYRTGAGLNRICTLHAPNTEEF
jgi:hypothetical protein